MKDENEHRLTVIRENPINDAFEEFRTSFALAREEKNLADDLDVLDTIDKLDQDGNDPATEGLEKSCC